jgi:hypothetical protein
MSFLPLASIVLFVRRPPVYHDGPIDRRAVLAKAIAPGAGADPVCPTGNLHIVAMRDLPVVPICRTRAACAVGQITGSISPVPPP